MGSPILAHGLHGVLAHGGASIVAATGEPQGLAPVELATLEGAQTLIAEACP